MQPHFVYSLILLLALFGMSTAQTKTNAAVLGFYASSGIFNLRLSDSFMANYWNTLQLAKNKDPSWPLNTTFELFDTKSNRTLMRTYARQRLENPNLQPVCLIIFFAHFLEDNDWFSRYQIPMINSLYTANILTQNRRIGPTWNHTFIIQPPVQFFFKDLVALWKQNNVQTFSVVYDSSDAVANPTIPYSYSRDLCVRSATDLIVPSGLTLLDTLSYNVFTVKNSDYVTIVKQLQASNPDAVILCTLGTQLHLEALAGLPFKDWIVSTMRDMDYTPKTMNVISLDGGTYSPVFFKDGLLPYLTQATFSHEDLAGIDYTERSTPYSSYFVNEVPKTVKDSLIIGSNIGTHYSSAKNFITWFQNSLGKRPTFNSVAIWACLEIVEAALYNAATNPKLITKGYLEPADVEQMVRLTNLPTPYGRMIFDEFQVATGNPAVVIQWYDTIDTKIVAPSSLATHAFVYPMPKWSERTYQWSLSKGNAKQAETIGIVGSVIILSLLITLTVHRQQMDIRMLNHGHLCAMLICCLVFLWGLVYVWQGDVNQSQCDALLWTIYLPMSFVIQLVNMKAYRLSVFLTSENKKRMNNLSHNRIMLLTLAWTSFSALLLLIAQFVDPPTKTTIVLDQYRPSTNYNICRYHNFTSGIIGFLIVFHIVMSMACVIVVRNGSEAFKDGTIMKESFIIFFGGVIVTYIFQNLNLDSQTFYFLRTIFLGLGVSFFCLRLLASRCIKHWIPLVVAVRLVRVYKSVQELMPKTSTYESKVHSTDGRSLEMLADDENKWLKNQVEGTTTDADVKEMVKVFDNDKRFELFRKICERSHITENVDFLKEVYTMPKKAAESLVMKGNVIIAPIMDVLDEIKEKYCIEGADLEVNISHGVRDRLLKALTNRRATALETPAISDKAAAIIMEEDLMEVGELFDPAVKEIRHMLFQNIWEKFKAEETEIKMGSGPQ